MGETKCGALHISCSGRPYNCTLPKGHPGNHQAVANLVQWWDAEAPKKTATWTPGPWTADEGTGGGIFGPDGKPIMTAGPGALDDDGTGWANARLIAKAPTMANLLQCMARGVFTPTEWVAEARAILAALALVERER